MGVAASKTNDNRKMDERQLVVTLVTALAESEGRDPSELDYTLYEFIDPEVLAMLAAEEKTPWTFTFGVSDHQVRLTSDGKIFVDGVLYVDDTKILR